MNWEFIIKYLPTYERAAWLTLRIGVAGIVAAIVLGLVCATVQYYRVPVLRKIVAFYIELSRNTPLLVQLFFIYYGLPKVGISTNAEVCGVIRELMLPVFLITVPKVQLCVMLACKQRWNFTARPTMRK